DGTEEQEIRIHCNVCSDIEVFKVHCNSAGLGRLVPVTKYLHAWLMVALRTSANAGTTIDAIKYAKSTLKPQKSQLGVKNNDFVSSAAEFVSGECNVIRFHSLVEFDEGKRSCRKRLDGHNRRRRKPQPNALTVNSGSLLSNPPGSRYLLFSSPQIFSTTSMTDSSTGAVKVKTDISSSLNFSSRNSSFVGASSLNYKGERQFSFLQSANSSHPGVSVCQPLVNANPSSSNGGISQKMLLNGLNRTSGSTSSLIPNLQYKGLGMEGEQVGTIFATDQSTNTDLHGNGVFRIGQPGSSASGTHHTLTFSWEQMTQFSLQAAQVNLTLSQGFKHQISNLKVIAYEVCLSLQSGFLKEMAFDDDGIRLVQIGV
ncbi:hypothetical protein Goarm_013257, partial [Gossypium armourianum]|nr:hypothetical protein [Gossypium armourianum]